MAARSSPQERGADRRALVVAAARVVDRTGYAAATLREIAAEAGTTLRALKAAFPRKEDLARAVVDEQHHRMVGALDTALLRHGPVEALVHGSRAIADLLMTDPVVRAGARLSGELGGADPTVATLYRGWVEQVGDLLGRAQVSGDVSDRLDPAELGATVVSCLAGALMSPGGPGGLHHRMAVMWRTVIDGMAPIGRRLGLRAVVRDAFGGWGEVLGAA